MFDFKNGKNRFSSEGGLYIITCEIVITNIMIFLVFYYSMSLSSFLYSSWVLSLITNFQLLLFQKHQLQALF